MADCEHCFNVVLAITSASTSYPEKAFLHFRLHLPIELQIDRWMMFRKEVVLKISVWVHAAHESGVKPGLWSKIAAWAHLGWAARAPSHQHRAIILPWTRSTLSTSSSACRQAVQMFQYIFVFVWSRARVINVELKCWFSLIFSFFGPVNKNEWPISRPIYVNTKLKCFNNPAPCLWIQRQASDRIKCMARGLFRTIYQNVMHCAEDPQQPAARPRLNARKIGE